MKKEKESGPPKGHPFQGGENDFPSPKKVTWAQSLLEPKFVAVTVLGMVLAILIAGWLYDEVPLFREWSHRFFEAFQD
ncbi:MAG: hypothetical protein ABI430_03860 [Candidatus Taylorbacteria bacterium]